MCPCQFWSLISLPLTFSKGVFSDEGIPLEAGSIPDTGISRERITQIANVFSSVPDDFTEHRGEVHVHVYLCSVETHPIGTHWNKMLYIVHKMLNYGQQKVPWLERFHCTWKYFGIAQEATQKNTYMYITQDQTNKIHTSLLAAGIN